MPVVPVRLLLWRTLRVVTVWHGPAAMEAGVGIEGLRGVEEWEFGRIHRTVRPDVLPLLEVMRYGLSTWKAVGVVLRLGIELGSVRGFLYRKPMWHIVCERWLVGRGHRRVSHRHVKR